MLAIMINLFHTLISSFLVLLKSLLLNAMIIDIIMVANEDNTIISNNSNTTTIHNGKNAGQIPNNSNKDRFEEGHIYSYLL